MIAKHFKAPIVFSSHRMSSYSKQVAAIVMQQARKLACVVEMLGAGCFSFDLLCAVETSGSHRDSAGLSWLSAQGLLSLACTCAWWSVVERAFLLLSQLITLTTNVHIESCWLLFHSTQLLLPTLQGTAQAGRGGVTAAESAVGCPKLRAGHVCNADSKFQPGKHEM
eukprot:scaffold46215_cov20-Tisochrysis_lutea.AAC.1